MILLWPQMHRYPLESLFLLCWGQARNRVPGSSGNFVSAFMDLRSCFPQCFPVDWTKLWLCTRTSICHYLWFLSNLSELLKSSVSGLSLHFSNDWACWVPFPVLVAILDVCITLPPYEPHSLLSVCVVGLRSASIQSSEVGTVCPSSAAPSWEPILKSH